jgi:hypothetical protein
MISLGLVNFAKRMVPIGRQDGCKQEEWLMLRRFFQRNAVIAATFAGAIAATPAAAGGGGVIGGGATEWTQLLNNSELIAVVGKSTEQINNQITQITQLAQQIQNQLRIYENMLQNTAQLPQQPVAQYRRTGAGYRLFDGKCRRCPETTIQELCRFQDQSADRFDFLVDLAELVDDESRHDRREPEGGRADLGSFHVGRSDDGRAS